MDTVTVEDASAEVDMVPVETRDEIAPVDLVNVGLLLILIVALTEGLIVRVLTGVNEFVVVEELL